MVYCEFLAGVLRVFVVCICFVLVDFRQWLVMLLLCVVNFVGDLCFGFIVGCDVGVVRCFGRWCVGFSLGASF